MASISIRIRRARSAASLSQTALALQLGINRSAVAQWEREQGTRPNVEHLAQIACVTGVCFEWLATGRGPSRPEPGAFDLAVIISDYAQDEVESRVLAGLRRVPQRKRIAVAQIIELFST